MTNWISVLGFGILGVGLRYSFDRFVPVASGIIPWSTVMANALGCFLAGLIFQLHMLQDPDWEVIRVGLLVGFCGGFTTLSAVSVQTLGMISKEGGAVGVAYLSGTLLMGVILAYLGSLLGGKI